MNPDSTRAEDVALATDSDVVRVLVENHARFLAFLERRVGSREAAEDILQDAFVRGVSKAHSIRASESATAWFYRLLRNAVVDHWRRRGAERRALDRVGAFAEETVPGLDEQLLDVVCRCASSLLSTLKPEYAEALRTVDLEGRSVSEYAQRARLTPNNASVRLHRARAGLRRQVERSCGTCSIHGCLDCTCGLSPGPAVG
jgi:RNA polymerase sigma-70 factor (ECF subfamily)